MPNELRLNAKQFKINQRNKHNKYKSTFNITKCAIVTVRKPLEK